ncbi:hypothetical protein FNJ88_12455 [Chryseobacterium sp. SNU WT5]|uniref:DUF6438 domain-containing protein n=1 Tax=Chryseobacterium sp. SNU WT5 TaxID=2594269 RepID=UPI00117E9CE9|nr:DUF6438 domain-containing protein [Chryseobacterium sp. SNU WT5]QDP86322.1 hypothetical protein FNJ88_12455 [Chryseobacterium sp. SNU WT5]
MKYLLSLLVFTFMISCSTTQNASKYSKIEYSAGACFGFCPIYKMTIDSDRTALFEAERFNFSRDANSEESEGTFKGTLKPENYRQLVELLDSQNPKDLKDYYGNKNVSDLPSSNLIITYQDGTVKKIQDYGKHGTKGLEKLYQFFDSLKTNQNWTKIK